MNSDSAAKICMLIWTEVEMLIEAVWSVMHNQETHRHAPKLAPNDSGNQQTTCSILHFWTRRFFSPKIQLHPLPFPLSQSRNGFRINPISRQVRWKLSFHSFVSRHDARNRPESQTPYAYLLPSIHSVLPTTCEYIYRVGEHLCGWRCTAAGLKLICRARGRVGGPIFCHTFFILRNI